jgi:hypothetical protein
VRELLHEEDKAVVDEIIMKKNHSTDPSTSLSKSSLSQVRQKDLLLSGVLESVPPQRNYDLQNQRLLRHEQTNRFGTPTVGGCLKGVEHPLGSKI